ncbi:MAG: 2-hydroxyacyl-CoA dehydratase [Firmicutes bacterium]|nr:2-hydroxyacyl-CoA dehydratase [Bacillota bacterium]
MSIEVLEVLKKTFADPGRQVKEWKQDTGGKAIGFLLTEVPEELIHAAGFFPFGICGGRARLEQAEAHLQSWACSYVRKGLAMAINGELDFLDGIIVPLTCDSTRLLPGIWKHNKPLPYMDSYRLPKQVERPSAKKYLFKELERIKYNLSAYRGKEITDEELKQSIRLYNSNRGLLRKLYNIHEHNPEAISNKDLYTVLGASMVIEREKLNRYLSELVATLEEQTKPPAGKKKTKLYISGTFINPPEVLDYLDESGGTVVGDDLKNGYRYIQDDVEEAGISPLESLVNRQLKKKPFAGYDVPSAPRRYNLVKASQQKKAQGVLFLHLKYCEPENYDYYDNLQALEQAGIPSMRIETEFGDTSLGQLQTRIHAFMEMVGGESNV